MTRIRQSVRQAKCWLLILSLFVSKLAFCNEDPQQWFIENPPQQYMVKKGDTLWDIAGKFLKDHGRWKQVWHANPEIENPNLIYPGDKVLLTYVQGELKITAQRCQHQERVNRRTGVVKLSPRARRLPADKAIPTIPIEVIGPFLNESRVVTPDEVECSPKVVALDEDHIVVGAGDLLYVSGLPLDVDEAFFTVYRPWKTYEEPNSRSPLGIEGLVLGQSLLEVKGEPARMKVTKSLAEIRIGDKIINTLKETVSPYFMPKYPCGDAGGQIISVFGGLNQIGQFQVVVITGGENKQREIGDVLAIFQDHKDMPSRFKTEARKKMDFPPLKVGELVVFRVFEKVSYGLVMNATRAIYLLDDVDNPIDHG